MATFIFDTQILNSFGNGAADVNNSSVSTNFLIIYKGTIPADADSYTEAGSSADELVRFTNLRFTNSDSRLYISDMPDTNPVNATASGTASWAALFSSSTPTRVILMSVSNEGAGGPVTVDSTTITSGNPVELKSAGITFTGS